MHNVNIHHSVYYITQYKLLFLKAYIYHHKMAPLISQSRCFEDQEINCALSVTVTSSTLLI